MVAPGRYGAGTCPMAASSGFPCALDVLHRVMRPTSYRRIRIAIEIASNLPAFFVVVNLLLLTP